MMLSRTRAILSSTALFAALSLLPKLLAIAKDMVVASSFGATQTLDVYLMAFVLIGVPVSIVVVAIQTTLIPALVNRDADAAARLLGGAIKLALGMLAVALPVWLVLLPLFLATLYPGSSAETRQELFSACLWLIPYYFINGMNLLLYGALQARKAFWPNAVFPGFFPIAILASVWLTPKADIRSLLVGTVLGSALEAAALLWMLKRGNWLRWRNTSGAGLMPVLRLALPLMAGGVMASLAPVVEQLIAFRLGPGAVSLLSYGNKVPAAVNSLLLTAIGIIALPHFAELISRQEWNPYRKLYLRLSGIVFGIGAIVAITGMIFSEDIVRLLFERGAFSRSDTLETAAVMRAYLLQLPFLLLAMLSVRALAAMGKTLAMTWISAGQMILAGGLAYLFSAHFGVVGVALGTTVAVVLGTAAFGKAVFGYINEQSRGLPT